MAYGKPWMNKKPLSDGTKKKSSWNPNYKKSTVVPGSQYRPITNPSSEQVAIMDAVVEGDNSVMVEAYAGCAKTSTFCETAYKILKKRPNANVGYFIFAKRNQEEAVGKNHPSVESKTVHSFGLKCLTAVYGKITVDKEKTDRIAMALVGPDDNRAELRYMMAKAIDLAKDYLATTNEEIIAMVEKHGIEMCDLSEVEFSDKVLQGIETSVQQPNIVSFSDMVFLPIRLGVRVPTYDYLGLDEDQDLNRSRIELSLRALGTNGKLIGLGDINQAIFSFSGADRHAMEILKSRANAITLPLHKTFRCGRKIVELNRALVPDYEAADTNPEGEVVEVSEEDMMSDTGAMPGDFILSRCNAPLAKIAMRFLKQGRKICIQGKDLGSNLIFMIKRSRATDVASFQSWLKDWESAEIERLVAKKKDYEHITDKVEMFVAFCEGQRSLEGVKAQISSMFDETESNETHRITASSIHKSKGLQRNRTWLLETSFTVKAKTEEDQISEKNVRYVGQTRSVDSLFLVG